MSIEINKPNISTGKPWSDMDVDDLKNANLYGSDVPTIADFLCRNQTEVYAKARELGLRWSNAQRWPRQAKRLQEQQEDRD